MSNLPSGYPNAPDGKRSHSEQDSRKGVAILIVGILICVALIVGGAVALISRSGGNGSPSSSTANEIRPAIFGDECDGRFDKYGDMGVFDIFKPDGIQYWKGPQLPPIDTVLNAVYIMDRSNRNRQGTRLIDPESFSEQQRRQLYTSLNLYVSDETRNSSRPQWLTIGSSSVVLYGTVGVEGSSSDGRIDSPDLNICVGNANA